MIEEIEAQKDNNDIRNLESIISIKTKKHKSLGVLSLVFIRLFHQDENGGTLTVEDAI